MPYQKWEPYHTLPGPINKKLANRRRSRETERFADRVWTIIAGDWYALRRSSEENRMKQAVSISLGSATRDKQAQMTLLGESVSLRREGMNGDLDKAAARFAELDGEVDALGMGGINLAIHVGEKSYPLHSARKLVGNVHSTPLVDGAGLKNTLATSTARPLSMALA
jgi:hypothetical protein